MRLAHTAGGDAGQNAPDARLPRPNDEAPAIELMSTTLPPWAAAIMRLPAARAFRNYPVRFVRSTSSEMFSGKTSGSTLHRVSAGIVDQDVDLPELLIEQAERGLHVTRCPCVALACGACAARGAYK